MPDADHTDTHVGPYGEAALRYFSAGWSPLPLPARAKKDPPKGWTGAQGAWPSGADVYAWTEDHGGGNVALRLPPNVIGVDVDAYGDKVGGLLLADLEGKLGPLPPTWRSTSRDDGVSGIRFYTVPEGLRWPSVLGPGIEVIRYAHRYAVAWPSIHPDTGGTYRWVTPDGATALTDIPTPETLPSLPGAWVEHFTKGELAVDQAKAGLNAAAVGDWLTTRGAGPLCPVTDHALKRLLTDLAVASSRHDAALTGTNRLVWTAGLGHTGAVTALGTARAVWLASVGKDRAPGEAEAEWDRLIVGAVDLAAAAHPNREGSDPCLDPFHGLLPPGTTPAVTTTGPGSTTSPSVTSSSSSASPAASPTTSPPPSSSEDATPTPENDNRTTWWPRDADRALDDTQPEPGPSFLVRDDGHALFYPGRVNGIVAPSESGKTWVALLAAVQATRKGQRVTILDFEDSHKGITGRLRALGMDKDEIRALVAYIGPDEPFHPLLPTGLDLAEHLRTWQPELIILDGFNAAMTMQGLDLMSNKDATTFAQQILKPLTIYGAAVLYIDHTPKDVENKSSGGIGAQAKRAMTTGCALKVEVIKAFGKGQEGKLRLRVDKDRQGDVRGISLPGKMGHWAADVTISNAPGSDIVEVTIHAPAGSSSEAPPAQEFRPTGYMDKVSRWLLDNPGAGVREVRDAGLGKKEYVEKALALLVEEGWVEVSEAARNKREHRVVTDFNELLRPPNECAPECAPSVPPGHGQTSVPPCPPGPDVVRPERGTLRGRPDTPSTASVPPGPQSRIVERVIAGKRVRFNLDTGQVEQ